MKKIVKLYRHDLIFKETVKTPAQSLTVKEEIPSCPAILKLFAILNTMTQ